MAVIDLDRGDSKGEERKPWGYVDEYTLIQPLNVKECYMGGGNPFVGTTPEKENELIEQHNRRVLLREGCNVDDDQKDETGNVSTKAENPFDNIDTSVFENEIKTSKIEQSKTSFKSLGEFMGEGFSYETYALSNAKKEPVHDTSPLARLMKNDYVEIVAYNIQVPQVSTNTRPSKFKEKAESSLYEPSPNPINWMPIHTESAQLNMTKLSNLWHVGRDGRRSMLYSRDSNMFHEGVTERSIFQIFVGYMSSSTRDHYSFLEPAYIKVRELESNRLVYRTHYAIHYDEAVSLVKAVKEERCDKNKDPINWVLGELLSSHPDYVNYGTRGHHTPNLIYVCIDVIVDVVKLTKEVVDIRNSVERPRASTFVVPFVEEVLYVGEWRKCPTWKSVKNSINEYEKEIITNGAMATMAGVTVVKEGEPKAFFYRLGEKIYSTMSRNDSRKEGIYVYNIDINAVKESGEDPVFVNHDYIPFEKAEENGFYVSQRDCSLGSNYQKHLESKIEDTKLQTAELNNIRSETEKERLEVEKEKLAAEKVLDEAKHQSTLAELLMRMEATKVKDELTKTAKDAELASMARKLEMEEIKNHYESRSYDRKDTSEALKMTPMIISGVIGVATALGGMAILRGGLAAGLASSFINPGFFAAFAIASMTETGYRVAKTLGKGIGAAYGFAIGGIRAVGKAFSKGASYIIDSVWEGGKSVVNGVGSFVSDTYGSVRDTLGGAWDFIFE